MAFSFEVKKSIPEAIQYKTDFIPNINKRLAFKKMDENTNGCL